VLAALAVGGPGPVLPVRWDFSLPLYVLLSLVLAIAIARFRPTAWTALACLAAATLWKWTAEVLGVVPAASLAILAAAALGLLRGRRRPADDR
jgi:VanZ family protein